jgi:hypothetical protein
MNETGVDSLAWSPRKLGIVVAMAVLAQVALILWFSPRGPLKPRAVDAGPAIRLVVEAGGEWLTLTDPTVFSRAHPAGFSGVAWLSIPAHSYLPTDEADAPLWLALAPESLGATFREFVKGYTPEGVTLRRWRPPVVTAPTRLPAVAAFESQVGVEGALAARGIVSQPALPAWTNADVLPPSRVQVLVDARGNPISAVLLGSSGLKAADHSAVDLARRMRFGADPAALLDPEASPNEGLATGRLIFSWRTLAPATNGVVNPR